MLHIKRGTDKELFEMSLSLAPDQHEHNFLSFDFSLTDTGISEANTDT